MRRLSAIWTGICFLVLVVPASRAIAKGPADSITITGSGLGGPIQITDTRALDEFSPWGGRFIDWSRGPVSSPPREVQTYEVVITVNGEDGQPHWIYTLHYYPDPSGQGGYVYLPRPGEKGYEGNIGTIIRGDGWYYASADWSALMQRVLKANRVLPISSQLASITNLITGNPWLGAFGVILTISSMALLRRKVRGVSA